MNIRMPPDVQCVDIGGQRALFIDDFLEDPQALVAAACSARFEPAGRDRQGYPGLRADAPAAYTSALADLLEPLVKANFPVPDELPIKLGLSSFSLTTTLPADLGPRQRVPHFDASTPNYMAALLWLCDERHGGTGFYRHNASGLQRITAENRERYLDLRHDEINDHPPPARYFDRSDADLTLLGMLPARFNRLALYPGSLLHSACINPACSLNRDPRLGRLSITTFCDF